MTLTGSAVGTTAEAWCARLQVRTNVIRAKCKQIRLVSYIDSLRPFPCIQLRILTAQNQFYA